ncbi:DUF2878 domain-containing protein [Shewanella gaetbuli]|uniref:DUF2878 domain-containing protein n=1 Tax=Shewanella gaetbuli TaxID=220752 RepID=A0A9X2CIS1_9GAMM|nr:DUF2878 domain-containing protein [Shewanella gaetbuli]MCL1141301.1 DUF2878 domain-containing protein [Shewanella gaetbuli]
MENTLISRFKACPTTLKVIINAISFQCIWWLGVLYQNQFIALSIAFIGLHFLLTSHPKRDFQQMLLIGLMGICTDFCLIYFDLFQFSQTPWWLMVLWVFFALTLNSSLKFAQQLPVTIQAVLGGVFGSLSYFSGFKLGAVSLPLGTMFSTVALIVIWSVLFPVLLYIAKHK